MSPRTYALRDGMTLVVVGESGKRTIITFHAAAFADIEAASGEEVQAVLTNFGVAATIDSDGTIALGPSSRGRTVSTVDVDASTAAAALGMSAAPAAPSPAPAAGAARAPAPASPAPRVGRRSTPASGSGGSSGTGGSGSGGTGGRSATGGARGAARLRTPHLMVHNLTASPIQLIMVTRTLDVPAGGAAALSPAESAHRPLQRLAASGAVRLTFGSGGP